MPSYLNSKYALVVIALFVGLGLGWKLHVSKVTSIPPPISIRNKEPEYKYINSVLFTEVNKSQYPDMDTLESKMNSYIKSAISDNEATKVSVYFRYLNNGHWTGVNEDDKYSPGSMLKVAILLGYLRSSEEDPNILYKRLNYVATLDSGQYYKPDQPLKTGNYSVKELLDAMIIESDNTAADVLVANDSRDYEDLYKIFQLPLPSSNPETTDFMSAHSYSSLFRVLYNASYLSSSVSDQALKLLTYTTFKKGLVAGVPEGTTVAHKFGEHRNTVGGEVVELELHDCGIIYNPDNPYFLCVMTKGNDFPKLEGVISGMSSLVYNYVTNK